jgi:transposase
MHPRPRNCPSGLTDKQPATLAQLKAADGEVWRAYELKEAVRGIFEPGLRSTTVEILIDRLLTRLACSRLELLIDLGKTTANAGRDPRRNPPVHQPGPNRRARQRGRFITRRTYGFDRAKAALVRLTGPITLAWHATYTHSGSGDTDTSMPGEPLTLGVRARPPHR